MELERSEELAVVLDRATFARLFDGLLPPVYAFVASRINDRAVAEDVTAATFRRAADVAREEAFDATAFASFAFRVAADALVDQTRRSRGVYPRGVRASDFDRESDPRRSALATSDEAAARALSAAIDRRALRRAIQRLPDAQRRLIVLRYLDGLTTDEQCAALGWNRETLARRIHGALRALHAAMTEEASGAA